VEKRPQFLSNDEENPTGIPSLVLHGYFYIATWHIWKQRNNHIFEGRRPTVREWTSNFIEEARLQAHRIKDSKRQDFLNWVNNVQL